MSLDEYWDSIWNGPTQAEVDAVCNRITAENHISKWRAAHPESPMSDTTVRALLVIEAVGRKR